MKEILKLDHIQKYYGNGGKCYKSNSGHQLFRSGGGIVGIMGSIRFRQDYPAQLYFHH